MKTTSSEEVLHQRARDLGLYGVLEHWQHFREEPWLLDSKLARACLSSAWRDGGRKTRFAAAARASKGR